MTIRLFFVFILLGLQEFIVAQNENHVWYFGNQAGLDFNSGTPVVLTNSALITYDYSSTVSDSAGNLLFYTNGVTIWNKNHAIMTNGTGLMGNTSGGQSSLAIRQPNTQIYYIFTTDAMAGPNGLRYTTVDMALNGNLGGVVQKNILLFAPSTEKIDGVYNCTDNSYWIITHQWNSNQFCSYKLTTSGLNTTPVTSNIGSIHSGGSPQGYNAMGQMTLSKDGSKLACGIFTIGTIEIFDFDINTGIISNPVVLTGFPNAWGTAFSPDSKLLYTTSWYDDIITQLDVTLGSPSAILSSAVIIGTVTGPGTSGYYVGYLELAPDNKIYAPVFDDTYLAVINNPNSPGTSCNFSDNGLYLGGKTGQVGLSKTIAANSISNYSITISAQNFCFNDSTYFILSDTNNILSCSWNFGDSTSGNSNSSALFNPSHIFSSPGSYIIQAIVAGNCDSDTILQIVIINSLPQITISGNAISCEGDTLILQASGGISYNWNNGDIDSITMIMDTGLYAVTVTDYNNCFAFDSVTVVFNPRVELSATSIICEGDSIFLQDYYQTSAGIYYDSLSTINGCDSIIATNLIVKEAVLDSVFITICEGDSVFLHGDYQFFQGIYFDTLISALGCDSIIKKSILTVSQPTNPDFVIMHNPCTYFYQFTNLTSGNNYYLWNFDDGYADTIKNPSHVYSDTGSFSVTLISNPTECADTVTKVIKVVPLPIADFLAVVNCNLSVDFNLLTENYTDLNWNFGDGNIDTTENPKYIYDATGLYIVLLIVFDSLGCSDTALKEISVQNSEAKFSFINQECTSEIYFIDSSLNANSYFWNFGDLGTETIKNPSHIYQNAAEYEVTLIINNNTICADTVSQVVNIIEKDVEIFFIPNAFSPNSDGLNDIFEIEVNNDCSSVELMIFSRWGELIFTSKGTTNAWDGKYNGSFVQDGIYAYILRMGETIKRGHIAIIK